jgi:hypothetical protein
LSINGGCRDKAACFVFSCVGRLLLFLHRREKVFAPTRDARGLFAFAR